MYIINVRSQIIRRIRLEYKYFLKEFSRIEFIEGFLHEKGISCNVLIEFIPILLFANSSSNEEWNVFGFLSSREL